MVARARRPPEGATGDCGAGRDRFIPVGGSGRLLGPRVSSAAAALSPVYSSAVLFPKKSLFTTNVHAHRSRASADGRESRVSSGGRGARAAFPRSDWSL